MKQRCKYIFTVTDRRDLRDEKRFNKKRGRDGRRIKGDSNDKNRQCRRCGHYVNESHQNSSDRWFPLYIYMYT